MNSTARYIPPTDQILGVCSRILRQRTEWEEPPECGFLCVGPEGGTGFQPMPIPATLWWAAQSPKSLLHNLANQLPPPGAPAPEHPLLGEIPDTAFGIYLRTEAWAVPPRNAGKAARRRANAPLPPENPGRVEMRLLHAIDVQGTAYEVTLAKGQVCTERAELEQPWISGGGVEALHRVVRGVLSPDLPPFRDKALLAVAGTHGASRKN